MLLVAAIFALTPIVLCVADVFLPSAGALPLPAEIGVLDPLKLEVYRHNGWYAVRGTCVAAGDIDDIQVYPSSSYNEKILGFPVGMWQSMSGKSIMTRGSCSRSGQVMFDQDVLEYARIRENDDIYFFVYVTPHGHAMLSTTKRFDLGNNGDLYPN